MQQHRCSRPFFVHLAVVLLIACALAALVGYGRIAQAGSDAPEWEALRDGGTVVLIRHAQAPGTGDPPGFVLEDCSTQRNLSDVGRAQAVQLGETFRANGVAIDRVLSSGWCRCVETATLAFGSVEIWPPLNSFFQDDSTEPTQTAETRAAVAAWAGPGTLVLVTHQVNITALTGIFPASGEVIVLEPTPEQPVGFQLVGRIVVD